MQISENQREIEAVVERLRERLASPPRQSARRSPFDVARSNIDRIRKTYQHKINTTWHPIHSREGIEAKLAEAVRAALMQIEQLESEDNPTSPST